MAIPGCYLLLWTLTWVLGGIQTLNHFEQYDPPHVFSPGTGVSKPDGWHLIDTAGCPCPFIIDVYAGAVGGDLPPGFEVKARYFWFFGYVRRISHTVNGF